MDAINAQCHPLRPGPRGLTSDARPQGPVVGRDSLWLASGAVLSLGGGAPSLLMAYLWSQIVLLQPRRLAALVFGIDILFCLSTTLVLRLGTAYGVQRYGKTTQPYPGPFREATGKRSPYLVKPYMRTVMLLGIPTPLCAIAYLAWQGQAALGFCTLAPYLLQLLTQIISEGVFMKQKSVMWPQVPQFYQTYRLWQLMRGCALTTALNGPNWLWCMQAFILLIWYSNFAAVATWTPWLYRWQLQPDGLSKQQ